MGWTKAKSEKRIGEHLAGMAEIEIKPLEREVSDLGAILSESKCREIASTHVYADVSNFADLASRDPEHAPQLFRKIIRATHVYQRTVTDLVEDVFGGVRVHFQGARLHALFYRPADEATRAKKAVLFQLALADFVKTVFNPEFSEVSDFAIRSGADIGTVIGTKNGLGGDREMLFVGDAANYAAKIISGTGTHYLTGRIYDLLPVSLQAVCWAESGHYRASASGATLDGLLAAESIVFDRGALAKAVREERDAVDLEEVAFSDAYSRINFAALSVRNNKRILGATIFADLSGFTAYVAAATTEKSKKERLRVFAAFRKELAKVAKADYDGVRVQYQGDRVQVLLHLPHGDSTAIAEDAVKIALAMQSSMEITLKAALPEAQDLKLAVGIDMGTTLASRYGTRGQRDRMCLGRVVADAANLQDASKGGETAISQTVYDNLSAETRKLFSPIGDRFVVKDKLIDDYDRAHEGAKYHASSVHVSVASSIATVASVPSRTSAEVQPSRSHA